MILIRLRGGLGNQMFQYAAARRLAEKHSTVLKLDLTEFESDRLRKYSLHCFLIRDCLLSKWEVENMVFPQNYSNKLSKKLNLVFNLGISESIKFINERQFHFDAEILDAPNDVCLYGYWQSEKYFFDIADILRREFVVKYPQDSLNQKFLSYIENTESVSIHVRRTDYIKDVATSKIHATCDLAYYERSIRYIHDRVSNPHFFIFSDESQWVKKNLKLDFPSTIIDCNNASFDYEDLRLMSKCKHNIIANSSFSWWGSWLNSNLNKIVIAPRKWFNDPTKNTTDLLPDRWIKI